MHSASGVFLTCDPSDFDRRNPIHRDAHVVEGEHGLHMGAHRGAGGQITPPVARSPGADAQRLAIVSCLSMRGFPKSPRSERTKKLWWQIEVLGTNDQLTLNIPPHPLAKKTEGKS